MSFIPDETKESFIEIPSNTQHDLKQALWRLQKDQPEWFLPPRIVTSRWEERFVLTPDAGSFVANAIMNALDK